MRDVPEMLGVLEMFRKKHLFLERGYYKNKRNNEQGVTDSRVVVGILAEEVPLGLDVNPSSLHVLQLQPLAGNR